jgi:hypothetical protein
VAGAKPQERQNFQDEFYSVQFFGKKSGGFHFFRASGGNYQSVVLVRALQPLPMDLKVPEMTDICGYQDTSSH